MSDDPAGAAALRAVPGLPMAELGEGPWWDDDTERLFWVDITGRMIHRWHPGDGVCETHETSGDVGFAMLDRGGRVVAGIGDAIYAMPFDNPGGAAPPELLVRPTMDADNRFNDAACDPAGRLWAGTMHKQASRDRAPTGALYRQNGAGLELVEAGIGIANGLGWSPAADTMYFADTHGGIVFAYEYDLATGTAARRRPFATVAQQDGVPDGLAVDSAGRVFVAIWRGGRINVYAPDGTLADAIATPVAHPTSCCFGGPDRRTLFVTTARNGLTPIERERDAMSGRMLAMAMDVPGLPSTRLAWPANEAS